MKSNSGTRSRQFIHPVLRFGRTNEHGRAMLHESLLHRREVDVALTSDLLK